MRKIGNYAFAYEEYLLAHGYNNSNAELNYKAGVSALFSEKKEEAAGFLKIQVKGQERKVRIQIVICDNHHNME